MRVLFVTSEIFPLCKTGGLADVSAALPQALRRLGIDVRVMLPAYPAARAAAAGAEAVAELPGLPAAPPLRLLAGHSPVGALPLLLVDCPALYDRASGLYLGPDGREWPDNALRFGQLAHAAALVAADAAGLAWRPDLVHAQDWHTGLVPLLSRGACQAGPAVPVLFTVHNLAFQGVFPMRDAAGLGLPPGALGVDGIEWYGNISFLKAGLRFADRVTTVSANYAREALTPEFGCGLDGLLRARGDLVGILNGVDRTVWNPARDPWLACGYDSEDPAGKAVCKAELQRELGLSIDPGRPLIAFVSRLTQQKMADTVAEAVPAFLARGAQFTLIGDGDARIEAAFRELGRTYPGAAAIRIGYEEKLAHRIYAGADIMLAPARFEPCGLTPMYAMRYGTVPVTRPVGGLRDAVVPVDAAGFETGAATGFAFAGESAEALIACVEEALALYRNPLAWRRIQRQGMRRDCGWEAPAQRYAELYAGLVGAEPGGVSSPAARSRLAATG